MCLSLSNVAEVGLGSLVDALALPVGEAVGQALKRSAKMDVGADKIDKLTSK
jgi:hypothetical protein